ncbi:MAG: tRNA (adenosine(37)-N6)-dimethylallyltransferase MiaA [Bacteroidales bacterium]|nr:tRNA (adenosine(37)-N6)-dimethylallyltransferase MiaA [Bacteroidales bacterium]
MMNKYLVVIAGPTAVGKTDLCIRLAQHFGSEIVSADSRQIYKELKIGTAIPSQDQLKQVQHHFIGNKSIQDYYNASKYEFEVLDLLRTLFQKHKIIILTGGSGLYIDALCYGIDDLPDVDPEIRQSLMEKYANEGIESLRKMLKKLDPEHYDQVDLKNHKRLLKALEVCIQTGKPYTSFLTRNNKTRDFNIILIGLNRYREELYNRINQRTIQMIDDGLVAEVQSILSLLPNCRELNALNTVGYKEIFAHLDGMINLEKAIDLIQRNTRKYARKQITWFRKYKDMKWFHPDDINQIIDHIKRCTK